jgi:hypothetical protein
MARRRGSSRPTPTTAPPPASGLTSSTTRYVQCRVYMRHVNNFSVSSRTFIYDTMHAQCLKPMWLSMWTDGEAQARFVRETKESLGVLDAQLQGKRFFAGDALGFVDLAACTLAHWLGVLEEVAGVHLIAADGEYPALRRWAKEYVSDEVVSRSLPDRDELVAFFTASKERYKSWVRAEVERH